jgi:hypothetical protein
MAPMPHHLALKMTPLPMLKPELSILPKSFACFLYSAIAWLIRIKNISTGKCFPS